MRFDIITIFPEFFTGPLDYGIVRRARQAGLIQITVHDLRDFTHDRHRTVDDRPFGGGEGMVLKPEPLFEAVESLIGSGGTPADTSVILLSASGKIFRQDTVRELSRRGRLVLLCGRYEGVDERVAQHLATDEISIGDFVLSGGELPAAMVLEGVTRLLPGALGNEASAMRESFSIPDIAGTPSRGPSSPSIAAVGLLDYPHYTRPQSFRGWDVPEVLVSGDHERIRRWRRKQALAKTLRNRPEFLEVVTLSDEDRHLLAEIRSGASA
jgi:tRNA (guanine37-N1)-methyltransferase